VVGYDRHLSLLHPVREAAGSLLLGLCCLVLPQPAMVSFRPGVSKAFWVVAGSLIGTIPVTGVWSRRTAAS